jgi:polyisoprenyl-teichoic acid--peptidoglycan teichoic acid transferase
MPGGETVIHETQSLPAASERSPQSAPRSSRMGRRRRVGVVVGLVLLVLVGAVAVQSWRVVSAIVDAERAAVVPLPTRESDIAFGAVKAPSGSPTAATDPTQSPPVDQATTGAAGVDPTATIQPPPTATATIAATVAATPKPAPTKKADAPSRLDVLREVVQAGMEDGDPGRSTVWGGKTDLYILVLGVDRRKDGGDQNADVIIIAHLDLINQRLAAVSIPRDLLVDIPGTGPDKINGSYNDGVKERAKDPVAGVAKVRDTIEQDFGVPIDGYVMLDFDGFEHVIDAVGGIEVDVPQHIHDDQYPTEDYGTKVVDFKKGTQRMNGQRALEYVRTRHSDSDDGRRNRQQQVLMALFEKGKGFKSVTRADNIILAVGDSVQTSFDLEQQLTLARLAYGMDESAITLSSLADPLIQAGETPDGRWAYVGDMGAIVQFVQDALAIEAPADGG